MNAKERLRQLPPAQQIEVLVSMEMVLEEKGRLYTFNRPRPDGQQSARHREFEKKVTQVVDVIKNRGAQAGARLASKLGVAAHTQVRTALAAAQCK